ncbi:MAG: tetratricopeptide repeat protein [Phycisphaerales bacterium]|nr:tetratricopeptide repeat protein [Phycisphaerales bacterium]
MARRVNTKFLVILTAVVLGSGILALVAKKYIFRQSPDKYIALADQYAEGGDYENATKNMGQAIALRPNDPALYVKLGDLLQSRSMVEPAYAGKELAAWNRALEIDPRYEPALSRLFTVYKEDAQLTQRPESFTRAHDIAVRLASARRNDYATEAYAHSTSIQSAQAGIATADTQIDDDVAALTELMAKDPANADIPFWISQAKLMRAQNRLRDGYATEAQKLLDDTATLWETILKAQGNSAAMHLRAGQVFEGLSRLDTVTGADKKQFVNREKYAARSQQEILKARELSKPEDELYVDVQLAAAGAVAQNDPAEAEKIVRELLATKPDDQQARLAFARLVSRDPAKRQEAIEVLSKPVKPSGNRVYLTRQYQIVTQITLANLQMDAYTTTTDAAAREALVKQIKEGCDKVHDWIGDSPEYLKLAGRFSFLQGRAVEAVQMLNRAMNLLAQSGRPKDYDLMFLLARAYVTAQQTGEAKSLLTDIVQRFDGSVSARLLLVELLLRENNFADAETHLAILEKQAPDSPDVARLRVALLKGSNQDAGAKERYSRMPEATESEKRSKLQVALGLSDFDEAARLLESILAQKPNDAEVIQMLARVYVSMNQKDKAQKVLEAAVQRDPSNTALATLLKAIQNESPEAMIQSIPDEFSRELALFDLAVRKGDSDGAYAHLQKAEKLKPDNTRVMEMMFQYHLSQKKWDQASAYLDKLAKANADQANGAIYRIRLAMAQGKYDDAVSLARDLTQKMGEFAQSWLLLGQALQASRKFDEAIARYATALDKQSENADAMRGLIQCYYALQRTDDARRMIEQARRTLPNDPSFREMEIEYNLNFGDVAEGVKAREAQLKANPDDPRSWQNAAGANVRLATSFIQKSDEKGAAAPLNRARTIAMEANKKWPDDGRFYAIRAEIALAGRNLSEGEKAIQEMLARDAWKDKPHPYIMLGEMYARFGKIDESEKALRQAMTLSKNAVDVEVKLASLLSQVGRVDDALVVLQTNADDPVIISQRIQILMAANRLTEAEKTIEAALAKSPDSPDLIKALAAVYINTGRLQQAMDRINQVLAKDPNDPVALRNQGLIFLRQGNTEAAVKSLSQARDINPSDVEARYFLGEAYRQRNQLDNAVRELSAALTTAPLNKVIRMKLIELQSNAGAWGEVERLIREARQMAAYENDPDWPSAEATMWTARGQYDRALTALNDAQKLAPNNVALVQMHFDILLQAKQYDRLLQETANILKSNDKQIWWIYALRGVANARKGDKEAALAEFDHAMNSTEAQANPNIALNVANQIAREIGVAETLSRIKDRIDKENRWRMFAAYLYQAEHDSANAVKLVDRIMSEYDKLTPQEQDVALRMAGTVYLTAEPHPLADKAQDAYARLLKKYPDDLGSLNNMACLLAETVTPPRPEQALTYSQRAYKIMEQRGIMMPLVLDTHGWVLTLCGRVDEGISYLRQALEKDQFVEGYYHLGEAYLLKQYPEEAQKQLASAQEMIAKADKTNNPVDSSLKRRVAQATQRAQDMIRAKGQAKAQ